MAFVVALGVAWPASGQASVVAERENLTPAPECSGDEIAPDRPYFEPDGPGPSLPAPEVEESRVQPMGLAGPVATSGTQPGGALSGVTVFATAGHGWTAGTSAWYLQRGLTQGMIEDYGNIDQLNTFVAYLFNAGATVVPFRPVGYQTREVVLDNDDSGVTYTGTWSNNTTATQYYENKVVQSGVRYRWASTFTVESATARYTPNIPATDFYPVYCWTLDGDDRARQTYRIKHSGGTSSVVVDHRLVGKGWIWLGNYYLTAGTSSYVEITNASPDSGVVVADAIRFGNGMGDVSRGSAGISGFPREEECMRYWAESELGNNAVGFSSTIWDVAGSSDGNDNVSVGAKWGREMNRTTYNNSRWRRIYLEFHSNAFNGTARGTVALVDDDWCGGPTTNQYQYAQILGDTVEDDMVLMDGQFEYNWYRRPNPYTSSYGAICSDNNGNEFDATILEVAFHDNLSDASLMRDLRVRNAVARSSLHGMIEFLHGLSGSTVPLVFLPEPPENVRAVTNLNGTVSVSWTAPPSGVPNGNAATGYRIYRSTNGYGFDTGLSVGNVLTYALNDIPVGQTTYIRVAATNAGGESMPSETIAVRRPASGRPAFLIVSGFDRLTRMQNVVQYAPGEGNFERQILRRSNSFDYVVQHAEAMASNNATFDSCSRQAVEGGSVALGNYQAVIWMLGEQTSTGSRTFSSTAQSLLATYLLGGGRLFVSGTDIAFDLIAQGGGSTFCQTYLKAGYAADDAGTYNVVAAGGIMAGINAFGFSPPTFDPRTTPYNLANGAYDADAPDQLSALGGATAILGYSGGLGGTAGVQYDAGAFRTVTFAFPFEMISSSATRTDAMGRIINFLLGSPTIRADFDLDGDVDLDDYAKLQRCYNGSGPILDGCDLQDLNFDGRVNQLDRTPFENCLNGARVPPGC